MSKDLPTVEREQILKTDTAYVDIAHFMNAFIDLMIRKGFLRERDVQELWRVAMTDEPTDYFRSKAGIYEAAKTNVEAPK